jgi:hypothetical protein
MEVMVREALATSEGWWKTTYGLFLLRSFALVQVIPRL